MLASLKTNFSYLVQDIRLTFSGLSYLTYRNSLANSYQILRWIMSNLASRVVLGTTTLFALEIAV